MAFVALKPCSFAGQDFRIGEDVPAELIQSGAVRSLITMGVIAEKAEPAEPASFEGAGEPPVYAYVHAEEGDLPIHMTVDEVAQVFDVLQATAKDAEDIISAMTNDEALFLLNIIDSRKAIKTATEARAKEINAGTEEDTTGTDETHQGGSEEAGED